MASVVDICNKALSLIGQEAIVSLDDTTPQAFACRTHWAGLRDEVLRGHPWNCATKRALLGRLVETPAFEYSYYFQLPSDCLMVKEIFPKQEFEIEGGLLLCNSGEVSIKYIKSEDDSTKYDSQLSAAFSFLLAAELAYQTTSSSGLAESFRATGKDKLLDAKASDAFEGKKQSKRGGRFLTAKYG